jgi:trk system potassium uptake protein TrkH
VGSIKCRRRVTSQGEEPSLWRCGRRGHFARAERPIVCARSIQLDIIRKSLAIIVISLLCVSMGIFLLAIAEKENFLDLMFEAVSAAATVGLSRGITADLSAVGQCIIVVLMLIGRVGPLTIAFTLTNMHGENIQYPAGQVNIG